jgi:hypothetical protein
MTLYASNVQRTRVELREEDGLFYLWAYRRGDGKTLFRDQTDHYAHALKWLCRFLGDRGYPAYRTVTPAFAANLLSLPPVRWKAPTEEVLHVTV